MWRINHSKSKTGDKEMSQKVMVGVQVRNGSALGYDGRNRSGKKWIEMCFEGLLMEWIGIRKDFWL